MSLSVDYAELRSAGLRFLLGGVSGALAKTLVSPLDRVKIIFQISRRRFTYSGLWAELVRTVQQDGVRGLFKGNLAQVARVLPYSGSQLCCFDLFSSLLLSYRRGQPAAAAAAAGDGSSAASHLSSLDRVIAGASAGAVSVALTYPLDLLRARLAVAQELPGGTSQRASGLWAALRHMHSTGGIVSLYRGLTPTLLGILPYAGISFAVYEALKDRTRSLSSQGGLLPGHLERLLYGGLAGFAGQAAAYPLDIVRRRMQTEGYTPLHAHLDPPPTRPAGAEDSLLRRALLSLRRGSGGSVDVLLRVVDAEGLRSLYKGLSLNALKGPLAVGVSLCTYDALKGVCGVEGGRVGGGH